MRVLHRLFFCILFFATCTINAQETPLVNNKSKKFNPEFLKIGNLGFLAGVSLPVLDFASTDLSIPSAGFAKTGYVTKLTFGYEPVSYLGFKLSYTHMQHAFNVTPEYTNAISASMARVFRSSELSNLKVNNYILSGMMGGLYYPLHMQNTSIDVTIMGGLLTATLPETRFNLLINDTLNAIVVGESVANNFAISGGVHYRQKIYKALLFQAALDFLYTEQNFENLSLINTTRRLGFFLNDYTQYYHILNFSVGLAIQFE